MLSAEHLWLYGPWNYWPWAYSRGTISVMLCNLFFILSCRRQILCNSYSRN